MAEEYKPQKHFTKDGDDDYVPRRPIRRQHSSTPRQHTYCHCGGRMKAKGSIGTAGHTSAKCIRCGKRTYTKTYKGKAGLARCW